jgi:hypothetical protein
LKVALDISYVSFSLWAFLLCLLKSTTLYTLESFE